MFRIYLPRVAEAMDIPDSADVLEESLRGSETILVLEDEEAARAVARDLLEYCGYTVLEASSPKQALHIAQWHQGPIHLLMTDVVLPQMGGPAVAELLEAQRPDLKVIYASGYASDALLRQGKLPHGRAFLQKPYTLESLGRKIRDVLDQSGQWAEEV